ncbi:MAG TPA: PKD domain-containing protein [Bacteroidia bacterium]|nr:PKD domain-containing protein [Bacteroidia bacterium]
MAKRYALLTKLFLSAFFLQLSFSASSQVFWTENFGTGCNQNQLASSYTGSNGTWTITATGSNGTSANDWFISATEAGMGVTNCGDGCLNNAGLTNRSLHVASGPVIFICPSGDCGAAYNAGPAGGNAVTDERAESPTINCTGQNTITLNFAYMEGGQNTIDNMTVWYFDGAAWSQLNDPAKTSTCAGGQGIWTASGAIALPASANNNPNVKIGFRWVNNDDGNGNDPSAAIDDVTLSTSSSTAPTAAFTASATSICVGGSVNFTDNSTGGPTSWAWTFPSGTPSSSTAQNPSGIVWNTAGTFTVTLTATNANGSTSATQVITVNPLPTISATAFPSTICIGQSTTLTGSGGSTYTWNPGALVGTSVSVSPGATQTYTVTGTSAAGCSNTATVTVTVQPCNVPQVNFLATDTTLCVGDCIDFTDQSSNNPTAWNWTFNGAATTSSTAQNPTNICYNTAGTFAVTLVATNANGNGSLTKTSYIVVNPLPTANAGADVSLCTGQSTTLIGSGGTTYNWMPGNGNSSNFFVTPASTTTYTLTVTDANGCSGTDMVTVNVNVCTVPTAALTISDNNICESTCINFTDNSSGTPTGWTWSFPGAVPSSSTVQNPTNICYNTPGTYNVTLIVTNAFGSDTIVMNNAVNVGSQPSVDAGPFVTIAIGNQTTLNASGGAGSYSWSPSTGLDNPNIANPNASPTVTTTYTVNFTDASGCTASDTVTVQVIEEYALFVPSAFSPNGDGANDVLFVRGAGIKFLTFAVYDRFGEKVFESQNINDGWDGVFRGQPMNTGIYVWYVTADFYNNTSQSIHGDVSLVR